MHHMIFFYVVIKYYAKTWNLQSMYILYKFCLHFNFPFIVGAFFVSVRMFVVVFMFLFHRRLLVLSVEPCPSSSDLQLYLRCLVLVMNE